jgi:hypothetical protein
MQFSSLIALPVVKVSSFRQEGGSYARWTEPGSGFDACCLMSEEDDNDIHGKQVQAMSAVPLHYFHRCMEQQRCL